MADEEALNVLQAPEHPPTHIDVKQIRETVATIERFKKKDPAKTLLKKIKELNDQKDSVYRLIHNGSYSNETELMDLNMRVGQIAADARAADKVYNNLMENKFGDFKKQYTRIYELSIREEGISSNILEGVLSTFTDYQKGRISYNKGTNMMLRKEQERSNLPSDFFSYLPEDHQ
jgi:hypothetical protein